MEGDVDSRLNHSFNELVRDETRHQSMQVIASFEDFNNIYIVSALGKCCPEMHIALGSVFESH